MIKRAKKNILILTPFFSPNLGGVETHLTNLFEELKGRGYFVNVLTYKPITINLPYQKKESGKNYYIRRIWWPGNNLFYKLEKFPALFNFFYLLPGLFFLTLIFLRKNYGKIKVIHSHGLTATFIAVLCKLFFNIPIVVSTHAIYKFRPGTIFSKVACLVFKCAGKVLALSDKSKDELIRIGVKSEKVERYYYWVNQKIFKPQKKQRSETRKNFEVLFVGRLLPIKGVDLVLGVARRIKGDVKFTIVGAGPLEEKVKRAALEMKNIAFVGKVDNVELPKFYNSADLFIMPSMYEEGFGRVVLEAMSCGVPILASNLGSLPEAVGEAGMCVNPTTEEFAERINFLSRRRDILNKMAKKSIIFAKERYSSKNIDIILNAYDSVVKKTKVYDR